MKRVFIDVGGYEGDACRAALDPLFRFTHAVSYEPAPQCADAIRSRIPDARLEVVCAALSDRSGEAALFGPETLAGSLFADHRDTAADVSTSCRVLRASEELSPWLDAGAEVFLKLNCEGGEIPIVEDLLDADLFSRIRSVLLDLDARKIPSLQDRLDALERRLASSASRNWYSPEEVQFGWQSTFGGIRNWLRVSGACSGGIRNRTASVRYNTELWLNGEHRGYYKFLVVRRLPRSLVRLYYSRSRTNSGRT